MMLIDEAQPGDEWEKVEAVYRDAVAHGGTLQYIPYVCGCGAIGHRHNADCYVAERHPDGAITFTNHGAR